MKISKFAHYLIRILFYSLFFLIPFVLTPVNYELFEYNKMITVYLFTVLITGIWLIRIIIAKQFIVRRTPLDIPIFLFFLSQVVSTYLSIDRHVSIWGYYSRFNGGLLSTVSYILLFYAFVTNFPKEKVPNLIKIILSSGVLLAIYGVLEHFGYSVSCLVITGQFNTDCWVQDVQNRVFATLGQPNWFAAYITILIPIMIGTYLISKIQTENTKGSEKLSGGNFLFAFLSYILYSAVIFTKSRSGFLAFWLVIAISYLILFYANRKLLLKSLLMLTVSFIVITFLFGAPFQPIGKYTLPEIFKSKNQQIVKPATTQDSIIDTGVTESGEIRKIVWKGAIEIFKNYPLFGTGVETFAFAYYKFRPIAHNMTSEWDFLYNKAHNEYLNFAATSGIFGLGSYLFIIGIFIWWSINKLRNSNFELRISKRTKNENYPNNSYATSLNQWIILFGLFIGWLSILITNFFGFSVVVTQLFFYLIPAFSFVIVNSDSSRNMVPQEKDRLPGSAANLPDKTFYNSILRYVLFVFAMLSMVYFILNLARIWYADYIFTKGYHLAKTQEETLAYEYLKEAILFNQNEPLYYDEFSYPVAQLAVVLNDEKQSSLSSQLRDTAIFATNQAVLISPANVNFWKTRTRVFYALSQIDEKYINDAFEALSKARDLSPTDPKIYYNMALIFDKLDKKKEAYEYLEKTVSLKPNYKDAYLALALFYERDKNMDKAKEALNFIINHIDPNDAVAKQQLEKVK